MNPITPRQRLAMMTAMVLSSLMASLDSSFVPLAFPDMIAKLKTSTGVVVWVALGYLVAATGPMLMTARIGDRVGLARMFQIGTVIYALSMAACAWAPDLVTLIALRLVQGVGMAIFLPCTFAIATLIYPETERGKALGILQSANAAGFVLGPVFAGFLLDSYDWRALFSSRIPLAAIAIVLAFVTFGLSDPMRPGRPSRKADAAGAAMLTLGLFGLLWGFTRLPVEENYRDWWMWAITLGGLVFLALFLAYEKRTSDPLVDLSLFDNNRFLKASVAFAAFFASFPVYLFTLPIVMVAGLEMRSWTVGMLLAMSSLFTMVVSPSAGKLSNRFGAERLCAAGVLSLGAGYLLLTPLDAGISAYGLIVPLLLMGVGSGLFFTPNNFLLMSSAPPERLAMVAGLIGTYRQVGYAVGFAVSASIFTLVQHHFDANWAVASLAHLQEGSARHVAEIFEEGGGWSPEVLIYILRMTAFVSLAMLAIALLNALPKLEMPLRRQITVLAAAAGATVLAIGGYGMVSSVSLNTDGIALAPTAAAPKVAAFSFEKREVVMQQVAALDGAGVYAANCLACHGNERQGMPNLGVSLRDSKFLAQIDGPAFAAFMKKGRPLGDPANKTGRLMPSFAHLSAEEVEAVRSFLTAGFKK